MIEEIRDYFKTHVSLAEDYNNILVDFLGEDAVAYTIEPVPVEPEVRPYSDGGALCQYVFQFGSKEYYDDSISQNISNLDFYERFKKQIEDNNKKRILPNIEGIQEIECLTDGSIQDVNSGNAKYVIQMRILYEKEE